MSTPRKPDLDRLVTALTADGRPDELTGREAAAAAFRAASRRDAADGAPRPRRVSMRRPRTTLPQRLAAIGAVAIVAAVVAAAAYTRALPGPAQELAHTVFAPLGVPDNQQPGHPPAVTIATSGGKSGRATPGGKATTPSPRPGAGVPRHRGRVPHPRAGRRAGRDHRTGYRIRPRRGRGAGQAVRTARRFRSVRARGHGGNRAVWRVQAAEPAPGEDSGLPGGRARCRAQRGGAGRGRTGPGVTAPAT